ncbi:MAG TPA: hypothetical protein VN673_02875, partial [Clostridia bacterium]|nr:hypothetical protein [Clostridia bacterium]
MEQKRLSSTKAAVSGGLTRLATEHVVKILKASLAVMKTVVIASLLVSTASAAHWFVRPSQQGLNNGTSWNNAWTISSISWSTVQPGDTIWLAGGNYGSSLSPGRSGSAGNPIYIKRVTSADSVAVASPGWSSSFDSLVVIPGGWSLAGRSYITFDGQKRFGMRVTSGGGRAITFHNGSTTISDSVQFKNMELAGPGFRAMGANQLIYAANYNGSGNTPIRNLLISNCSLHDAVMLITLAAVTNGVIENSDLYNCSSGDLSAWHPDVVYFYPSTNIFFRNNMVSNTVAEALWFDYGASRNIYFYGNTLHKGAQGTGFCIGTKSTYAWGPMYIYNNTFINYDAGGILLRGTSDPNTAVYNNVFYNSVNACQNGGRVNSDYNAYVGYSVPSSETHSISGSSNPFVNSAGGDFRLTQGSWLINKGRALSTDGFINKDRSGIMRGGDGSWDIGAFEYAAAGPATNPVVSVTPTTVDFGSVARNGTVTKSVVVRNVGGGTLAGTATVGAPFRVTAGGSYSLASSQAQTVTVVFNPTSAGNFSQNLQLSGGGGSSVAVSGSAWDVLSGLSFQSSAGTVTAPFVVGNGYISQSSETDVTRGGRAVYGFSVPTAGNYVVSVNVNASSASANSCYVNIDGEPSDPSMIWDMPVTTGFSNQTVSWRGNGTDVANQFVPAVFNLTAGTHYLVIRGREAGLQLGAITIAPQGSSRPLPPVVSTIASSVADSNPNAAGLQVRAGTAVSYSGSATDPQSLPLTWQWVYTVNGGAEVVYRSGSGSVAPASFTYPTTSASSTYVWKLRVSNGTTSAEQSLTVGVEAQPPVVAGPVFEAESGVITAPFTVASGIVSQASETSLNAGGRAVYSFSVTEPGSYVVRALVNAPGDGNNSLFLNIDGEPQDPSMICDIEITSGFEPRFMGWRGNGTFDKNEFVPKAFNLTAGTH